MLKNKKRGFTLLELLVALVIAGILVGYGLPAYRNFSIRQNISNHANDLLADINFARITALDQSRNVGVQRFGASWSNGWRIFVDVNGNDVFNAATDTQLRLNQTLTTSNNATGNIELEGSAASVMFNNQGSLVGTEVFTVEVTHSVIEYNVDINVALSGLAVTVSHETN
jgi:prepilin-type N-terminal cleavage/methylation domain-containing protein